MALICAECAEASDEIARGWEAHLAVGDDGDDELVIFCPFCAAREFRERG